MAKTVGRTSGYARSLKTLRRSLEQLDLLVDGESTTVSRFAPAFLASGAPYWKPSYRAYLTIALRAHILPALGEVDLRQVGVDDVAHLISSMSGQQPKSVNNVLSVLRSMLKAAEERGLVDSVPRIKPLRATAPKMSCYSGGEFDALVRAARDVGARPLATVYLGGHAGLRRGEMLALRWEDVDFSRGALVVARSRWGHHETTPKNGKSRSVPLSGALRKALLRVRGVSEYVLGGCLGSPCTAKTLYRWVYAIERATGLTGRGQLHVLRHTFCSHLAANGVPVGVIKELAGHGSIGVTERYMHFGDEQKQMAVRTLDAKEKPHSEAVSEWGGTTGSSWVFADYHGDSSWGTRIRTYGTNSETSSAPTVVDGLQPASISGEQNGTKK